MNTTQNTAERIRKAIETRREEAELRRQARRNRQEWIARDAVNEAR